MRKLLCFLVALMVGMELATAWPCHSFGQPRPLGTVHTVALTDTAAPAGGIYLDLDVPVVNQRGQVAFHADLYNGGAGVFVGAPGAMEAAALRFTASPAGGNYTQFNFDPVLSDSGEVAFVAAVTGETTNSGGLAGVFVGKPGAMEAVAVIDGIALGDREFINFQGPPAVNASGQVAFTAGIAGGAGVFLGTPETLQAVAITNTPAPDGGNYSLFLNPVLNRAGQVAFSAQLTGGSSAQGIFVGTPESVQSVALSSTAAPAGGNYRSDGFPFSPQIDSTGKLAFWAILEGESPNQGLFAGDPGNIEGIALQGDTAPNGLLYNNFSAKRLNLDGVGGVLFSAQLTNASGGIFAGAPQSLETIALLGDPAPLGGEFLAFGNPLVDKSGQVVFAANLTGLGVTRDNNAGLYVRTAGRLEKLVREGDQVDVDPGPGTDLRIVRDGGISLHTLSGGEDGRVSSFSRNGYLTYRLMFTDNSSGIFLTRLVAVPEPASNFLGLLSLLLITASGRSLYRCV